MLYRIEGQDMNERCAICGCPLHRKGEYAKPTTKGRSHATKHHFVAERFFGRSKNRPGTVRERIFPKCPWDMEQKSTVFCYECHEELIHNPVFLPEDIERLSRLMKIRRLSERSKPKHRKKIGGRIELLHEAISLGLKKLLDKESNRG